MPREIKLNKKFYKENCDYLDIQQFRIYDPNEKKFYYSGGTPTMLSGFFKFTASLHTYYKMPYQRKIGFPDKNKKDIYEGDILEIEPIGWEEWKEEKEMDSGKKYKEKVYYFQDTSKKEIRCNPFHHSYSNCEIIDNIYENPNLLK